MAQYRYFKVCPRGFANEVLYFRVVPEQVGEVEKYFAEYEDNNPGGHVGWSNDKAASMPGVAVNWEDRAYVGFLG